MSSFIEQCLSGHALLDEIDDFIDTWHESDSDLELHDFLGMSNDEFSAWVKDSSVLPHIIRAKRKQLVRKRNALETVN